MTALDTSVAVPALLGWHAAHDECRTASAGAQVPAHVLLETYSVLTRLPSPHRLPPEAAGQLLEARFPPSTALAAPADLQREIVGVLEAARVSGGAVYDGWIGLTAAHHGEVLLTRDHRAAATYDRLRIPHHHL